MLVLLILMLIFVFHTSASDCLEDRLRNELYCVERDVKPYSLTCKVLIFQSSVVPVIPFDEKARLITHHPASCLTLQS